MGVVLPPIHLTIQLPETCQCACRWCNRTVININGKLYVNGKFSVNETTQIYDNRKEATEGIRQSILEQLENNTKKINYLYLCSGVDLRLKESLSGGEYKQLRLFTDYYQQEIPLFHSKIRKIAPLLGNLKAGEAEDIDKLNLLKTKISDNTLFTKEEAKALLAHFSLQELFAASETAELSQLPEYYVNRLFQASQAAYRTPLMLAQAKVPAFETSCKAREELANTCPPAVCEAIAKLKHLRDLKEDSNRMLSRKKIAPAIHLAGRIASMEPYMRYLHKAVRTSDMNPLGTKNASLRLIRTALQDNKNRLPGIKMPFEALIELIKLFSRQELLEMQKTDWTDGRFLERLLQAAEQLQTTLPFDVKNLLENCRVKGAQQPLDVIAMTSPGRLNDLKQIYEDSHRSCLGGARMPGKLDADDISSASTDPVSVECSVSDQPSPAIKQALQAIFSRES